MSTALVVHPSGLGEQDNRALTSIFAAYAITATFWLLFATAVGIILAIAMLIAPGAINTMPEATLRAFADHGTVGAALDADAGAAEEVLLEAGEAGVDLEAITSALERDGVRAFCASYRELLSRISAVLQRATVRG